MSKTAYHWRILQEGDLALRPTGRRWPGAEHESTCVLIWPEGEDPSAKNTLLIDPAFTPEGLAEAEAALQELGVSWGATKTILVTHPHHDHMPTPPEGLAEGAWREAPPLKGTAFEGLEVISTPGHHPAQRGVAFTSGGQAVVAPGDAILDEQWLRAWKYYWPNNYGQEDIVRTWRTAAEVVKRADVIIPGHGAVFEITPELVQYLIAHFPEAEHAGECPDVADTLQERLDNLQ
jgi:glyoxylase-like metal-dependent hydrolase (beta-lactamase superfamily II)